MMKSKRILSLILILVLLTGTFTSFGEARTFSGVVEGLYTVPAPSVTLDHMIIIKKEGQYIGYRTDKDIYLSGDQNKLVGYGGTVVDKVIYNSLNSQWNVTSSYVLTGEVTTLTDLTLGEYVISIEDIYDSTHDILNKNLNPGGDYLPIPVTEDSNVFEVMEALLVTEIGIQSGNSDSKITGDINLPKEYTYNGITVDLDWVSDLPAIISSTGKVTRGVAINEVTLTATPTINGTSYAKYSKDFKLKVMVNNESSLIKQVQQVARLKATDLFMFTGGDTKDNITSNFTVVTEIDGITVNYDTSASGNLDIVGGVGTITRRAFNAGNEKIPVVVTLGTDVVNTRTFYLLIKQEEVLNQIETSAIALGDLVIPYTYSVLGITDLGIEDELSYGTWELNTLGTDGYIQMTTTGLEILKLPEFGSNPEVGVISITRGGKTRDFQIQILPDTKLSDANMLDNSVFQLKSGSIAAINETFTGVDNFYYKGKTFPLTYTLDDNGGGILSFDGNHTFTLDTIPPTDTDIVIGVKIDDQVKQFTLTIKGRTFITEDEKEVQDLTFETAFNITDGKSIESNLVLNPNYFWDTSHHFAIDDSGVITRPNYDESEVSGYITATKGIYSKDFYITVAPKSYIKDDAKIIDLVHAGFINLTSGQLLNPLEINEIRYEVGDTFTLDTNVDYLGHSETIDWTVSNNPDTTVTLAGNIVTVNKAGTIKLLATSGVETKEFTLTLNIRTLNEFDLKQEFAALNYASLGLTEENAKSIASNLNFSSIDASFVITSTNDAITNTGSVTQPTYLKGKSTGFINIEYDGVIKQFYTEVKPQDKVVDNASALALVDAGYIQVNEGEYSGNSIIDVQTDFTLLQEVIYEGESYPITWSTDVNTYIAIAGNKIDVAIIDNGTTTLTANIGGLIKDFVLTVNKNASDSLTSEYIKAQEFANLDYASLGTTEANAKLIASDLDFSGINVAFSITSTNPAITDLGVVSIPTYMVGKSTGFINVTYDGVTKQFYTEVPAEAKAVDNASALNLVDAGFIQVTEGVYNGTDITDVVNNFTLLNKVVYQGDEYTIDWSVKTGDLAITDLNVTVGTNSESTLTATIEGETKEFTVTVDSEASTVLSADDIALQALAALNYPNIKVDGVGIAFDSKIITSDKDGTLLTFTDLPIGSTLTSSSDTVINSGTGVITSPEYGEGDKNVILTVTTSHGETKDFLVTVEQKPYVLVGTEAKDLIHVGYIPATEGSFAGTTISDVKNGFTLQSTIIYKGHSETITWSKELGTSLNLSGNTVTIASNGNSTLRATVGGEIKDFIINVHQDTSGVLEGDYQNLKDFDSITYLNLLNGNTNNETILGNLDLSVIQDSKPYITSMTTEHHTGINLDGTINHVLYGVGDNNGYIEIAYGAKIKKLYFTVKQDDYLLNKTEAVALVDFGHLKLLDGTETAIDAVSGVETTFNLQSTVMYKGHPETITWVSSSDNLSGTTVTIDANEDIVLKAAISGGVEKQFTIHAKKYSLDTDFTNLNLLQALTHVNFGVADFASGQQVISDLTIPSSYTVTSSKSGTIALDGKVTRPQYGDGDKKVIITLTNPNTLGKKEFLFTVLEQELAVGDMIGKIPTSYLRDLTNESILGETGSLATNFTYKYDDYPITWGSDTAANIEVISSNYEIKARNGANITATVNGDSTNKAIVINTNLLPAREALQKLATENLSLAQGLQSISTPADFTDLIALGYTVSAHTGLFTDNIGTIIRGHLEDGDYNIATITLTDVSESSVTKEIQYNIESDKTILDTIPELDYYLIKDFTNELDITTNFSLPSTLSYYGEELPISWVSDTPSVIANDGSYIKPNYNTKLELTGTVSSTDYIFIFIAQGINESEFTSGNYIQDADRDYQTNEIMSNSQAGFIKFIEGDSKSSISGVFSIPKQVPESGLTLDVLPIILDSTTGDVIDLELTGAAAEFSEYTLAPILTDTAQTMDVKLLINGVEYLLEDLTLEALSTYGTKINTKLIGPLMTERIINGLTERTININVPSTESGIQISLKEVAYNELGNPFARNLSPNMEFGLKWLLPSSTEDDTLYDTSYVGFDIGEGIYSAIKITNNGFELDANGLFDFTKANFQGIESNIFIYNLKEGADIIASDDIIQPNYQTEAEYDSHLAETIYSDSRLFLNLNVEITKEFENDALVYTGRLVPENLWLGKYPIIDLNLETTHENNILINYGESSYIVSSSDKLTYDGNFENENGRLEYYLDIPESADFGIYGINRDTKVWEELDSYSKVQNGKLSLGTIGLKAIEFSDYSITNSIGTIQLFKENLNKILLPELPELPTVDHLIYVLSRGAFDYYTIITPSALVKVADTPMSYPVDSLIYQLVGDNWVLVDTTLALSDINNYKEESNLTFENSLIYSNIDFGVKTANLADFVEGIPRDNINVPNYNLSMSGRGFAVFYNVLKNKVFTVEYNTSFQPFINNGELRFPVGATLSDIDIFELNGSIWEKSEELTSLLTIDSTYSGGDQLYLNYEGATTGLLYSSTNITHVSTKILCEANREDRVQFYIPSSTLVETPPTPTHEGDAQIIVQEEGIVRVFNLMDVGGRFEADPSDPSKITADTGYTLNVYDYNPTSKSWLKNTKLSGVVDNLLGKTKTIIVDLVKSNLLYTDFAISDGTNEVYTKNETLDLSVLVSSYNDPLLAQNRYSGFPYYMVDKTSSPLYYLNLYTDIVAQTDGAFGNNIIAPKDELKAYMLIPYYGEYKAFLKTTSSLFSVISTIEGITSSEIEKNFEFSTSLLSPDITNPEFKFGYIFNKNLYINGVDIIPEINKDADFENDEFVSILRDYGVKIRFKSDVTFREKITVQNEAGETIEINQGEVIASGTILYFRTYGIPLDTNNNRYELEVWVEDNAGNLSDIKELTFEQGIGNLIIFGGDQLDQNLKDDILLDSKLPDKTPPRIDLVYQLDDDIYIIGDDSTPMSIDEEISGLASYAYGFNWATGGEVYPFILTGRDANNNQVSVDSDTAIPSGFEFYRVGNSQVIGQSSGVIVSTQLNFKLRDAVGNLTQTGILNIDNTTKYSILYRRDGYILPEYVENLLDHAVDIDVSTDITPPVITRVEAKNGYLLVSGYDNKLLHQNPYGFEFYDSMIIDIDIDTQSIDGTPRIFSAGQVIPAYTDLYKKINYQKVTYPAHMLIVLRDANNNLTSKEITVIEDGVIYQTDEYTPIEEIPDVEVTNTVPIISSVSSESGFVKIIGFDPEENLDMHPYGFEILEAFETLTPFYGVNLNNSIIGFDVGDIVPAGTLLYKEKNIQFFPAGTRLNIHLRDIYGLEAIYEETIEIAQNVGQLDPNEIEIPIATEDNRAPILMTYLVIGDQISVKGYDPEGLLNNYPYGYEFLEAVVLKTDLSGEDRLGNKISYLAGEIIPPNKVIFTQNSIQEVMPGSVLKIYLRDNLGVETSQEVTITLSTMLDAIDSEDEILALPDGNLLIKIPSKVEDFDWNTYDYILKVKDTDGEVIYEIKKDQAEIITIPEFVGDGLILNQEVIKSLDGTKVIDLNLQIPIADTVSPKIANVTYKGNTLIIEATDDQELAEEAYNIYIENGTKGELGFSSNNTKRVLPGDRVFIQIRDAAGNQITKTFTVGVNGQIPELTKTPKEVSLQKFTYYPEKVLELILKSKANLALRDMKILNSTTIDRKDNLISIRLENAVIQLQDKLTGEIIEVQPDLIHNGVTNRAKAIQNGSNVNVLKLFKSGLLEEFNTLNNIEWKYISGPAYVSEGMLHTTGLGVVELLAKDSSGIEKSLYVSVVSDMAEIEPISDLENKFIPYTILSDSQDSLDIASILNNTYIALEPIENVTKSFGKLIIQDKSKKKIRFSLIDTKSGIEAEYVIQLLSKNEKEYSNIQELQDFNRKKVLQVKEMFEINEGEKIYLENAVTKRQLLSTLNKLKVFYGDNTLYHRDFYRMPLKPNDIDYLNLLNLCGASEESLLEDIITDEKSLDTFITRADLIYILEDTLFTAEDHHLKKTSFNDITGPLAELVGKYQIMGIITFEGKKFNPMDNLSYSDLIDILINIKEYYR